MYLVNVINFINYLLYHNNILIFSFGQSAIFLIGGHDKASDPSAILLNSGDVIIMSKEARLCYHAVPKILPASSQPWDSIEKLNNINSGVQFKYLRKELDINETIDKMWTEFGRYIKESRININVRQVLKENQKNLNDVNNI